MNHKYQIGEIVPAINGKSYQITKYDLIVSNEIEFYYAKEINSDKEEFLTLIQK